MVLLSFLILIFGQTVLISCGTLQSINGTEVKGIVGETLKLEWIVTAAGNENVDASAFMVCLDENETNCIATGAPDKFSKNLGTAYTERIEAKYIDGKHVLKIKLVKKDDGLKLYIKAIFRRSSTVISNIKHDNVTIHVRDNNGGGGGGDGGSNVGAIVGGVIGAIAGIIIVVIVVFLVLRWKKNNPSKTSNSERMSALNKTNPHDEGTLYASTEAAVPQQQQKQQEYASLGAGGGRTGPREEPNKSLYAQVKTDEHGYPATGPPPDNEDGFNPGIVV